MRGRPFLSVPARRNDTWCRCGTLSILNKHVLDASLRLFFMIVASLISSAGNVSCEAGSSLLFFGSVCNASYRFLRSEYLHDPEYPRNFLPMRRGVPRCVNPPETPTIPNRYHCKYSLRESHVTSKQRVSSCKLPPPSRCLTPVPLCDQ